MEDRKVTKLKVVGFPTGSMPKRLRRKCGVPRVMKEGSAEWRAVGRRRLSGQV